MQRWFRKSAAIMLAVLLVPSALFSQKPVKEVFGDIQGQLGQDSIRVFLKDTLYRVSGDLKIQNNGVLIIEPGTTVEFLPNGRLINEAGGVVIADGRIDAQYNANPGNLNPLNNRAVYPDGYGDIEYFSYTVNVAGTNRGTVEAVEAGNTVAIANTRSIESEPTISAGNDAALLRFNYPPLAKHANEPDAATRARKLAAYQGWQPGKVLMYVASRIRNVDADQNIVNNSWTRTGGAPINVAPDTITFRGNSVNSFSREWGHIVVMPGARMSYFRQCNFENFLKDTTVDRLPYYTAPNGATQAMRQAYEGLNDRLVAMTNGSGAALTSFSVRTWLVGCNFRDNEARYHGGALQLLQAPLDNFGANGQQGVYPNFDVTQLPFYTQASNPNMLNITEPNGAVVQQQVRGIDRLGDVLVAPGSLDHPQMDMMRQSHDDARIALFLGRVRGLTFSNNIVRVRNVDVTSNGVVRRNDQQADIDTLSWKNEAFGGAMYVAGRNPIEVTLGNNNFYDGFGNLLPAVGRDYVKFTNNSAINLQSATPRTVNGRTFFTNGARGGALYVGSATSVILSGYFESNLTNTEFNSSSENFSQGGAVYASSNSPRIQIRGGLEVGSTAPGGAAPTHFMNNKSGRGGAVFAHLITPTNAPNLRPLVVGGSNAVGNTADFRAARDYGVNIRFDNNAAESDGGAIYSNKALRIIGGGGTVGVNIAYSDNDRVWFRNNRAGFSGGAVSANIFGQLDVNDRAVVLTRTKFETNRVGLDTAIAGNELDAAGRARVKGGGALYVFDGNLSTVLASEFSRNEAHNSNGGAIALILPSRTPNRVFGTDVFNDNGVDFSNSLYTQFSHTLANGGVVYPDTRSLTRFLDNVADSNSTAQGSGRTQRDNVQRTHPGTTFAENGTGLGGAIYILDTNVSARQRVDDFTFNRVRFQGNTAFSGAVVYSDNYGLNLNFQRCLVFGNEAISQVGIAQNKIEGPFTINNNNNPASSDLAGAVLYGEIQGPLPSNTYSVAANAIYGNTGRFLIRLPDAQNTKDTLAGTAGLGRGAVDTLIGNYWGKTGAEVITRVDIANNFVDDQETFFVEWNTFTGRSFDRALDSINYLPFVNGGNTGIEQGPFESRSVFVGGNPVYTYTPIQISDDTLDVSGVPQSIPERLLMQGHVYDLFDKGTDIKTADYSNRRMTRIEDFSVGIPPSIRRYTNDSTALGTTVYTRTSSSDYNGRVVRRWTRDPELSGNPFVDNINYLAAAAGGEVVRGLQTEFVGQYHPIGYPLFLESVVDYTNYRSGLVEQTNRNDRTLDETVFFVINRNTGDFIRTNLRQVTPSGEVFRSRVDLVPDDTTNPLNRRTRENLANFGVLEQLLDSLYRNAGNEDFAALKGRKYNGRWISASDVTLGQNRNPNNNTAVGYSNQGGLPTDTDGPDADNIPGDQVTYFAGERYDALPVADGDVVYVISRSQLWRDSTNVALQQGIQFTVTTSVQGPRLIDDAQTLRQNPYPELRNTVFVREDVNYPEQGVAQVDTGRTGIFTATATDTNRFWDPRALLYPNEVGFARSSEFDFKMGATNATLLLGEIIEDSNSSLNWWLQVSLDDNVTNANGERRGLRIYGQPSNPYVVPGGDTISMRVRNWPMNVELLNEIRARIDADTIFIPTSVTGATRAARVREELDKYFYVYKNHFNTPTYSDQYARYLQQDTINVAATAEAEYAFRIIVIDSIPLFTPSITRLSTFVTADNDTVSILDVFEYTTTNGNIVPAYEPTPGDTVSLENAQFNGNDEFLIANVSDSLRFDVDFQTNDEMEDSVAAVTPNPVLLERTGRTETWDFRYGRTAYGFKPTGLVGDENTVLEYYEDETGRKYSVTSSTVVVFTDNLGQRRLGVDRGNDTVAVELRQGVVRNGDTVSITDDVEQSRPAWVRNEYILDENGNADPFATSFTSRGKLSLRIDRDDVTPLLTPNPQYNEALNLDTVITVAVNDGHGGVNRVTKRVIINYAPQIRTQNLAVAIEDEDFNRALLDFGDRSIEAFDPNFNQNLIFQLLRVGDRAAVTPRDLLYPEAGNWNDIVSQADTPDWLQIDPLSGRLYGTPTVTDIPSRNDTTVFVTVVVQDPFGLTDVRRIELTIRPINRQPDLLEAARILCLESGAAFPPIDFFLKDTDLLRQEVDEYDWTIEDAAGNPITALTVVEGGISGDTLTFNLNGTVPNDDDNDGFIDIVVIAQDEGLESLWGTDPRGARKSDTLRLRVAVSLPVDPISEITVENNNAQDPFSAQILTWGIGAQATTGRDTRNNGEVGSLDAQYCEYELPPIPPSDVFDARWSIPQREGTTRNIVPAPQDDNWEDFVLTSVIQAGGVNGSVSAVYPLVVRWNKLANEALPGLDYYLQDVVGGNIFKVNMNTGNVVNAEGGITVVDNDPEIVMTIQINTINAFQIVIDSSSIVSSVYEQGDLTNVVSEVFPNPTQDEANIFINLDQASNVRVTLVNSLGREVANVFDGLLQSGRQPISFNAMSMNGAKLPAGAYTCRVEVGTQTFTKKFIVIQ